jgi:hypothetical protein
MANRAAKAAVVMGVMGAIGCGCGGEVSSVTSLPPADPVSGSAAQFCTDVQSYLQNLAPSVVPLACQYAVASAPAANCAEEFDVCTAAAGAAIDAGGLTSGFFSNTALSKQACESSIAKCSATVGAVAQCVADYGSALQSAASALSAQTACAGSGDPAKNIGTPASCSALPSTCPLATTTVTVTSSIDGG